jgi:hypothetical protein
MCDIYLLLFLLLSASRSLQWIYYLGMREVLGLMLCIFSHVTGN